MSQTRSLRRAAHLLRAVEKLDAGLRRRSTLMLGAGLLILLATWAAALGGLHVVATHRGRAPGQRGRSEHEPPPEAALIVFAALGGLGVTTAACGRARTMTLSQTVDEVLSHGVRTADQESDGGLAALVLIPLYVAATCGGWWVLESLALARARRRANAADRAAAVELLVRLRDRPAGLGTTLAFKPGEPKLAVRRRLALLTLHRLVAFDHERVWLTRSGNALMERAA